MLGQVAAVVAESSGDRARSLGNGAVGVLLVVGGIVLAGFALWLLLGGLCRLAVFMCSEHEWIGGTLAVGSILAIPAGYVLGGAPGVWFGIIGLTVFMVVEFITMLIDP